MNAENGPIQLDDPVAPVPLLQRTIGMRKLLKATNYFLTAGTLQRHFVTCIIQIFIFLLNVHFIPFYWSQVISDNCCGQ